MKHLKLVTQRPAMAQTEATSFEVKINFLVDLVDRVVIYVFQKEYIV